MVKVVDQWFFYGLPDETTFDTRDGVDIKRALRHISACMRSFQPKHEHKVAGVAYLLDLFFEKIEVPPDQKSPSPFQLK